MATAHVIDQFNFWKKSTPNNIFLRQPDGDQWVTWTYKQAADEI